MSTSPIPLTVKDFTVLPILYKSSSSVKRTDHFLYLREHICKPRNPKLSNDQNRETYPNGRTLFVVNVPPDATERDLRLFFQSCGYVERVILQKDGENRLVALTGEGGDDSEEEEEEEEEKEEDGNTNAEDQSKRNDKSVPNLNAKRKGKNKTKSPPEVAPLPSPEIPLRAYRPTGSTTYIVFADLGAVSNALQLPAAPEGRRSWPLGGRSSSELTLAPYGLALYVALHAAERPPLDALKKHADSYLEVYEYNKAILHGENKRKYKQGEAIVDEDGFTLVVRGGAHGQSASGGVGVASKTFMKEMEGNATPVSTSKRKKKKKHEKEDFYKFQIHEKRRQELIELKASFEKDKQTISAKRARYNPY